MGAAQIGPSNVSVQYLGATSLIAARVARPIVQQRTVHFAGSCYRKRAEGNTSLPLRAPVCRSLFIGFSEPLRCVSGSLHETDAPSPDTPRSPSPSPGCVSRRGFVFRPDASVIEDEVGAQRFSFSVLIRCRFGAMTSLRCCGISPRCNNRYMTRNYSWMTL